MTLRSLLLVSAAVASTGMAQQNQAANVHIQVLPVQGNLYIIAGAGGNIAVQVGQEGVLVVDTGLAGTSDAVLAEIRKLSDKPLQYILNTHFHQDHTGGNEAIRKAGVTITGANVTGNLTDAAYPAHLRSRSWLWLPHRTPGEMAACSRRDRTSKDR